VRNILSRGPNNHIAMPSLLLSKRLHQIEHAMMTVLLAELQYKDGDSQIRINGTIRIFYFSLWLNSVFHLIHLHLIYNLQQFPKIPLFFLFFSSLMIIKQIIFCHPLSCLLCVVSKNEISSRPQETSE
jgi:hypothetical protein